MNMTNIEEYVDQLFRANRKKDWAEIPIVGGDYLPGVDNTRPLKKIARLALAARDWFAKNGPVDAQPLPLSHNEREDLKSGGIGHILAWYARSLEGRKYNYLEHPSFSDYACGVMASEHTLDRVRDDEVLRKRFPPRPLDGLDWGNSWNPPKLRH